MKKLLALLMSVALLAGMLPAAVIGVSAQGVAVVGQAEGGSITVDGKTVIGVEFNDITLYQGLDPAYIVGWDEHDEPIYRYYFNIPYTLRFDNGTTQTERYNFWDDNGNTYSLESDLDTVQERQPFTVGGAYTVNTEIAGFRGTVRVTVEESPVIGVEIEDTSVYEYEAYECTGVSGTYYEYYPRPAFTVILEGGEREHCDGIWTAPNGTNYSISVEVNQEEEPFRVGEPRTVTGRLGDCTDTFTVTVLENPIDRIVFEDAHYTPADNRCGYTTTDENNEEYFHYEINWDFDTREDDDRKLATVYMKDGREFPVFANEPYDPDGSTKFPIGNFMIDGQIYDFWCEDNSQAEPGRHYQPGQTYTAEITVRAVSNVTRNEYGGYSYSTRTVCTASRKIVIADFPVRSITVTNATLYKGIHFTPGSNEGFYSPRFVITLSDGSTVDRVYGSGNRFGFEIGQQYYNLTFDFPAYTNHTLEVGKTYTAYAEVGGQKFPITYTTVASPIKSLSVTARKEIPLNSAYFDIQTQALVFSLYDADLLVTVQLYDGTTQKLSMYDTLRIDGDYYYFDCGFVTPKPAPGKNRAYLTVCGTRCEFDVTVEKSTVSKLAVTGSLQLDATKDGIFYGYGDVLDYDRYSALKRNPVSLKVTYTDGTTKTFTVDGTFDKNKPRFDYYTDPTGAFKAIIIFGGKSVAVPVKVTNESVASPITKVALVKLPDFPCGVIAGNTIIWDGMQVKLTFASGATETVTLTEAMRDGSGYTYTAKNGVKYLISLNSYVDPTNKTITAYACGKTFTLKTNVAVNSVKKISVLTAATALNSEDLRIKITFADGAEKTVTLNKTVNLGGIGGNMGYMYQTFPMFYDTGLGFILDVEDHVKIQSGKATRSVKIYADSEYRNSVTVTDPADVTTALVADMASWINLPKVKFTGTQTAANTDAMVLSAVRYYEFSRNMPQNGIYPVTEVNQMVMGFYAINAFDATKSSYYDDGMIRINGEMDLTYVYSYARDFKKNGTDTEFTFDYDSKKFIITVDQNNRVKKIAPSVSQYTFKLASSSLVYNGKEQKPAVTASGLTSGTDFSVSYKNNTSVGTATVTVKGITFTGSASLSFKIVPKQVTGLKATEIKTTSLKVSWSKVTGAKYYKLEKSTDGKTWSAVTTTTATAYTVKSLKSGTNYQFRATALDSTKKLTGKASAALKATTLIAAPTGLKATDVKTTSLKVGWSKSTGAKYYKLEKSTDGKKWTAVTTTTAVSYTVKSLKAGTKYQFRVTALDSAKKVKSAVSTVLKTGTATAAPALTLKSTKSKTATASWKKITGASKYVVYKSTDGKKWTKVTTTTSLTYTLTKLTGNKKIYVRVTALNAYSVASAYSATKNVTVKK